MSQTFTDDCYDADHVAAVDLQAFENNFAALKSAFSGASAPSNPVAGIWWYDTTSHILKLRNELNNAWLSIWDLANNKPIITNLSNEITGAMIAASAKDPAAGTAGLRTLGTGANQAMPGDTVLAYSSTMCVGTLPLTWTGYTKVAEIKIIIAGTYRVTFGTLINQGERIYARIYKNGSPYGTEVTYADSPVVMVMQSESLSFAANDLCQLYAKSLYGNGVASVSSFRVDAGNAPQVQAVTGGMY